MKKLLLITLSFICSSYSMQQKNFWTPEEDQKLTDLVNSYNDHPKWIEIASQMPGRKGNQCRERWFHSIDPKIKRGDWTDEEDQLLIDLVNSYNGHPKWIKIAEQMSGRTNIQCRKRWKLYLDQNINHSKWTDEEDLLLIRKYNELGPKWAKIKDFFKNRTDSQLNIRYKIIMKKTENFDFNKNEDFFHLDDSQITNQEDIIYLTKNLDINKNEDFLDWNDWEYFD